MGRRAREVEKGVAEAAAMERAKIVKPILASGEYLVADPAIAVCQLIAPERSPMLGVAEEAFLFSTDRRLLYRTASGDVTLDWRYGDIAAHRLGRCTETRLVCALSAWSRLRGLGWSFATLRFTTVDAFEFAVHGSRPFLSAVASVLNTTAVDARAAASTERDDRRVRDSRRDPRWLT